MDFTLQGSDPRFRYLKQRLEADGHRLTPDSRNIIAPPAARTGIPYYNDPIFALENAALTAEGAAELLMRRSDGSILGMPILLTGYGRIGQLLAGTLARLGSRVTVAVRNPLARASARVQGFQSVDITYITGSYDAVINTIPAPILRGNYGASICLDLASAPGGWADDTPILRAPGLPAIYAPKAAADIMAEAIYRISEVDIIE